MEEDPARGGSMTWKILLGVARLMFDIALIWMLFGRGGKRGPARVLGDGQVEFAPDRLGLWAWPFTAAYLALWIGRDLIQRHTKPSDFLNPAILGLTVLMLLFSFPGTIVATAEGLEKVYWLRKNKHIRWKDIVEIETDTINTRASTVTITSASGTKIVHSWLLADRRLFILEIEKHCGEELPPDFPREAIGS
jgi:hypothetical protein